MISTTLFDNPRYLLLAAALAERDLSYVFIACMALSSVVALVISNRLASWSALPPAWRTLFTHMDDVLKVYNLLAYLTLGILSYLFTV